MATAAGVSTLLRRAKPYGMSSLCLRSLATGAREPQRPVRAHELGTQADIDGKGKNFWEAPLHPSEWTGNQRGFLVLMASGVASYSFLRWYLRKLRDNQQWVREMRPEAREVRAAREAKQPQQQQQQQQK